jgi:AraC-like DNA-binding protein
MARRADPRIISTQVTGRADRKITPARPAPVVVIIDGDPGMASLAVLLRTRLAVVRTPTASEGLLALKRMAPALVVIDVGLPDLHGADLCRGLRARFPDLPIVLVAHGPATRGVAEIVSQAIDGFFPKPLAWEPFVSHLRALLPDGHGLPEIGPHVARTLDYIARHYHTRLALAPIAKAIGISRAHLAHVFRTQTGTTVGGFVMRMRIELAAERLIHTDDKLDAIAQAVGFADASHLSRVFHRLVGRWPGDYRRNAAGGEHPAPMHDVPTPIQGNSTPAYCRDAVPR